MQSFSTGNKTIANPSAAEEQVRDEKMMVIDYLIILHLFNFMYSYVFLGAFSFHCIYNNNIIIIIIIIFIVISIPS